MTIPHQIKNIIFDFGGVIINIDFEKTYRSFMRFGIDNMDQLFSQAKQTDFFDRFEKGLITPSEFRKEVKVLLGIKIGDETFDDAWNSMILNIPKERIDVLIRLKKQYRTFLLSNSNRIHYDYYLKRLNTEYGIRSFDSLFEKAYFSFQIKMIKPRPLIFEYILAKNNLLPSETLFVDDTQQNITAAKNCGLQTLLIEKGEDISGIFQ
ncbi:MAG: HAD family phosphatase [Bacteroidota bacterium]